MSTGTTKSESLSVKLKNLSKQELNKRDVFGRTILHIICVLGRFDLLKHLLQNSNLNIYIADYESGWTGLHHSIFYGKISCARLLLGYSQELLKVKDRTGLTAMDIYHLKYSFTNLNIFPSSIGVNDTNFAQRKADDNNVPDKIWWDSDIRGGSELFTFGINVNNHLGTGDSDDKSKTPYKVDIDNDRLHNFSLPIADRLVKPRIKDIKISKNHSVLLTNEHKGNILISGNPSRGRLGHGSLIPNYKFTHLEYFSDDHISDIALSDDHTMVLTKDGEVYAWGLNNYYQLGYTTERVKEKIDTFSNEPRRIIHGLKKLKVEGISCSKIHSAAYSNKTLILWGLNIGQMDIISSGETVKFGKHKGTTQVPRKIEFQSSIKQVIATDTSTIVLLDSAECHIMHSGLHLRFQLPLFKALNNEFEYFRPTKFSKRKTILKLVANDCAKIGILYDDGSVSEFGVDMFSKSSNIKYSLAWSPRNNHLQCHDVDIGKDGSIIICTKAGSVYKRISRTNGKSDYKFAKIDRMSKVVKVCCDSLFSSFGFIKDDVDQLPMDLPANQFFVDINYLSPLTPSVFNRRKSQLVGTEEIKKFPLNFLNSVSAENSEESEAIKLFQIRFSIEDEKDVQVDPLYNAYIKRWSSSETTKDTFQKVDFKSISATLSREDLKYYLNTNDFSSSKDYDLQFDIDDCRIGVHKSILMFIPCFHDIYENPVTFKDIVFSKVDEEGCIKVDNLHVHSLLIILNLLYTGSLIKVWDNYSGHNRPPLMREVKDQTIALLKEFKLVDDLQRIVYNINQQFSKWDSFDNDVTVKLADDEEEYCCSYILSTRNAFFETLFSERWDGSKELDFSHVEKRVFEVALRYIYGYEQLALIDDFDEITTVAEFVNLQFDVVEFADEILMFGLKDLAQLMIKDFINQNNVLLILHHAELLNCNMLIGECLWYIYNNVDLVLLDSHYNDELLSQQIIKRIDSYFRWMNKVNKITEPEQKPRWYDNDTGGSIRKFLYHIEDFNNHFLEGNTFEPLFDIKQPKKETKSPKLESKKTRLPSPPLLSQTERKKSVSIDPVASWSRFSNTDTSAIEFTDEDFQPVTNRRRKSSAKRSSSSAATNQSPFLNQPPSPSVATPTKSIPIPESASHKQVYTQKNNSVHSLTETQWPGMSAVGSSPGALSPFSNWASSSNGTPITMGSSPSSVWKKSVEPSSSPSQPLFQSSGVNKSSFGSGSKMSQKERKRLMKTNEPSDITPSKTKSNSAWNTAPPKQSEPSRPVVTSSLLAAQEAALASERNTPSLAGIIHEEQHKALGAFDEKKSLAEIQKEEEFALWWEAESRKVQQELNGFSDAAKKPQEKGKSRKKSWNNSKNRKRSVN